MKHGHVYELWLQHAIHAKNFSLGVQIKKYELRCEVDTVESSLRNLGDIQQ